MFFGNILREYGEYVKALSAVREKKVPVGISGVVESAQSGLIYALAEDSGYSSLVIAYSDMEAKNLFHDLQFYTDCALYFPSKEYIFYDIETAGHQNEYDRLNVLYKLCNENKKHIVVTSLEAVLGYTAEKEGYLKYSFTIELGKRFSLLELEKNLVILGYTREDMVEGKGQFSVRGGILDIFCPYMENPVRVEFFGDEADSIREFDVMTQRSMDKISKVVIAPCSEVVFDEEKKEEILCFLSDTIKRLKKTGNEPLIETLKKDMEHFEEKHNFPSIDKYAFSIYQRIPTILEYLSQDSLIFVIEPKRISERNKSFEWEKREQTREFMERGILFADGIRFWASYDDMLNEIGRRILVSLKVMSHTADDFKYKTLCSFATKTTVSFHGKIEYLYDDLRHWQKNNATVVILASNRGRGENLAGTLNDKAIACRYVHDKPALKKGEIVVVRGNLSKGFEYPEINFVLVSDREIFAQERQRVRTENTNKIKSYNDISVGDYVVHQAHGIGQYAGIHKMSVNGVTKDYLKIQYQGTDTLYVPVDQMNMLYKYIGNTDIKIKLNKLGGTDWTKTKDKVKKSTKELARQLISLYAEREHTDGYAFSCDTPWQREFEDTFIYQETEDQLRSIEEVKADMEKKKPMDRLLCGDVGYGKTEIALRAAFKAAMDSKQVAYLCPTTILAMQQYNNFCARMENFPIKVEMLSRFRTPNQQKKILKQLKTGEIDIVIGTHRILQKDLEFKDLGLLIVDEEQRFGVTHKEKLKEMKKNVDVLTMTATPIPRTLHMAMINIRDMSVLAQPPENRYPVQTYVLEHNPQILVDAMKKELARGGQVFYLFNRVQGIYRTAEWIKAMIPEAKVAVGHGKMKESELEDIMYDMVNGNTDILVCTTIIETGLDIPNANTMIIENADKMGLAQLYQLRGRVGRSNRTAYAYLTYKKDSVLSEVAQKRLRAVKEFTEFGSGFKIAMRDLEIRGAGNILGAEQHGHMDAVGYDMYCKLLKESINEARGIQSDEDISVSIDIEVDAYIPDSYIKSHNQRIDIYKKIAAIENEDDSIEIDDELVDRYGDLPKAVQNLINIALIKSMAKKAGICEIVQSSGNVLLKFAFKQVDMRIIAELAAKMPSQILFSASEKPYITYRVKEKKKLLENIKFILQTINELKSNDK
ncbi:MAG: transcription-repair coupling factor [Clostridia bacterium]|nr:transcription-repair coupling factor [Clostridia bacterium]